jgi:hypothetical protein
MLAVATAATALGAVIVGASSAATPAPRQTINAKRITRRPNTVAPGTAVTSANLGQRVFVDATHGFALASVARAQYPAATTDGGVTWKTAGPALHVNAAQAPLVVLNVGAAGPKRVFYYGGGQVVDTTSDGGATWYGAIFNGLVMAVVRGPSGHLVAFVDGFTGSTNSAGAVWQYISKDGGRSWHYNTTAGG